MDKEALIALIADTKNKINDFEEMIFKEKTEEYSIYRAETSIYLDTIKFLEGIIKYDLNADEIEEIKVNLIEIQNVLKDDEAKVEVVNEEVTNTDVVQSNDEFKTINFDVISEEVNNTAEDYASIDNFLNAGLPA